MKNLIILISLGTFLFFGVNSCNKKDDENPCSVAWATELQDEANALIAAAQAYGANPNTPTCTAYKNAAQAYVDALEPYGDCATLTGQQRTEWEAALSDAQDVVDAISC